jgi:hypothetical protein
MAVDKALNRAPLGLAALPAEDDFELEIELPPDEDAESSEEGEEEDEDTDFSENLAEVLPEAVLVSLASDLIEDFDNDINSRADWIKTYVDGLELLGLKSEEKSEPWPGACGVFHPLLSEALVKFQAETMMETFPAAGPVKTQIIGEETPEKKEAAVRVRDDMNNQLCNVMLEYRPEHERMLWGLGLAGNAFKKVYYDPSLGRQTSLYIPAEDVVVPYGASNIQTSERVTHVMRKTKNEVERLQAADFYRQVTLGEPDNSLDEVEKKIAERMGFKATNDERYKILEMHVDLYIEEDKYASEDKLARPYVVTVEKGSSEILAVRRNWKQEDERAAKRQHFVHYPYIPGFGFYAFGLIHLIGAFAKSSTSILRQLVDAGTLSNLPGGFKTKGFRAKGDDTPIGPGEFRDVDVGAGTIKDNIMALPYKEPSQVLYTLLGTIVDEARRFASAADLQVSDMSAQSPVGTTLAILERTLKVMSAVQARIHFAMKQEFNLLRDIIRDYTPEDYEYEPEDGPPSAKKSDYDLVAVIPVSDPNAATMAQKVVQYQAVMQLAAGNPEFYDLPYLHRQMLEVLGINNAAKLVPLEDDLIPTDPVSENMALLNGKPTKAFIHQDHASHIAVHTAMMNDPMVMQTIGQNPKAPVISAALQAHVVEHLAFEYRRQIEEAAGVPYPPPDAEMDPALEVQVSRLAAAAAGEVLGRNQAMAAAQQAQAAAQDPIVQMQQQELALKGQEVDIKKKKLISDVATAKDKLDLERQKIASQEKIAGLQIGAKIGNDKAQIASQQKQNVAGKVIDLHKQAADHAHQQKTGLQNLAHQHVKNVSDVFHQRDQKAQDHKLELFKLNQQASEAEKARQHQSEQAKVQAKNQPKPTKPKKKEPK